MYWVKKKKKMVLTHMLHFLSLQDKCCQIFLSVKSFVLLSVWYISLYILFKLLLLIPISKQAGSFLVCFEINFSVAGILSETLRQYKHV